MEKLVHEIIDDMKRAFSLNRSLFLIVYYGHDTQKVDFLQLLEKELVTQEIIPMIFDPVNRPEHSAGKLLPHLTASAGQKELAVLADFPRNKDSRQLDRIFLGYINLHRDVMFQSPLRLLILLHRDDAQRFMDIAGDLWDFRQRSYWLEPVSSLLTLPLAERTKVEEHIKDVRALVEQTTDHEEKNALMIDLSRWLTRRNLGTLAAEIENEAGKYLSSDSDF